MREKVGNLDCLKRPGENSDKHVVILHGFGADAQDLFPLADYLDPDGEFNFYFPDAPNEVDIGGGFTGLGWFPISVRSLEVGLDLTKVRPPGMNESVEAVGDMIFHLNSKKLYLGGFSQGAMIATEVAMRNAEDVEGLILYSGTLLDEANWLKLAPNLKGKRFLQSHGMMDSVLPIAPALKLHEHLKKAGAVGEMISFPGGHEIPPQVLQKTAAFLKT